MNRTIKFRGQRFDTKEWVYTGLLYRDNGFSQFAFHFQVIPETVGQFTGLLDRNGKEIYEGDIVEYNNYDFQKQEQVNTTHEIIWWNDFSCFTLKNSESDLTFLSDEFMEVIGNIHDK